MVAISQCGAARTGPSQNTSATPPIPTRLLLPLTVLLRQRITTRPLRRTWFKPRRCFLARANLPPNQHFRTALMATGDTSVVIIVSAVPKGHHLCRALSNKNHFRHLQIKQNNKQTTTRSKQENNSENKRKQTKQTNTERVQRVLTRPSSLSQSAGSALAGHDSSLFCVWRRTSGKN